MKLGGRPGRGFVVQAQYNFFNRLDRVQSFLLKYAAGNLPVNWFYSSPPVVGAFKVPADRKFRLEIVSHCWGYATFMQYQLGSLVSYTPENVDVTMTVFYSEEDEDTVRLLDYFSKIDLPSVDWNFVSLDKYLLFRRSIGRNLAAKSTNADWIWFTDCDSIFNDGCIDSLVTLLEGETAPLVFPKVEYRTDALADSAMSYEDDLPHDIQIIDPQTLDYHPTAISRATGPLQITRGDVAREIGYCDEVSIYQKPAKVWSKCVEDRIFRWLVGSQGKPLPISNVCRIQHKEKGRYDKSGFGRKRRMISQRIKLMRWRLKSGNK